MPQKGRCVTKIKTKTFRREIMKGRLRKILALCLAAVMACALLAGCGSSSESSSGSSSEDSAAAEDKGTIIYLSQMTSGAQYEALVAYGEALCEYLGYDFTVVYGDTNNDPAENLNAVANAMTSDVVGIIACQDGGISNILEEYPDLYVIGAFTDMASVYDEDGSSHSAYDNDHFLGTLCDGYADGTNMGIDYAEEVIANGYTKVATITFPDYAYPQLVAADEAFREYIAEYNETADEQIEIVGDATILVFSVLEDSYFLDEDYQDLDAIVAFCSDSFVYSTLKTAQANGTCSADTKLLSSGWEDDSDYQADIGETIAFLSGSPVESIGYSIIMLDNAISGLTYSDMPDEPQRIDSVRQNIRDQEDVELLNANILGTGNAEDAWISVEEFAQCALSVNSDATYEGLLELYYSGALTTEAHR